MKVISLENILKQTNSDLLVCVLEKGGFKEKFPSKHVLSTLDKEFSGLISQALTRMSFKAEANSQLLLGPFSGQRCSYLLVVGWEGKKGSEDYRKLGGLIYAAAKKISAKTVTLAQEAIDLKAALNLQALLEGVHLSAYKFDNYKSKKEDNKDSEYAGISELHIGAKPKDLKEVAATAATYATATMLARDLVNTPPNDCIPRFLADTAREIAKKNKLKLDIFGEAELRKMGAGAILGVSAGSDTEPYLIRMKYPGKKGGKRIAIVGKGVTFDSGGLSIKSGSGMETMKCDMSGAAAVLAVMSVIQELQPKAEVWGYVPATENMINGKATRPGDILKAMNGKTIEVLNTDAEGRLILADALSLAIKDGCDTIVDLATLTGACLVALGESYAGLFSNDEKLRDRIFKSAGQAGESFWELPLIEEYKSQIKSSVADLKNIGTPGAGAGATIGALFLQEFVGEAKWAHLDIAGPAFTSKSDGYYISKGGVGFGVRTLLHLLQEF